MKNSDEFEHQGKKKRVSKQMLRIKNIWKNMFVRKKEKVNDMEDIVPQHSCPIRTFSIANNDDSVHNDVDIMDKDKDRIRTSCKLSLQDIPEFPSRDEVRKKIEDAHKYYGIKCVYNYYVTVENSEKKQEPLPSWYYILERPLVEQYVLMNNYIRKLSILSSEKGEIESSEALEDEEEVSSISSQSDYSDFPKDSKLINMYKKSKRECLNTENDCRRSLTTEEKGDEIQRNNKPEVTTIATKDYKIVMRGPKWFDDTREEDRDNAEAPEKSSVHNDTVSSEEDGDSPNNQLDTMKNVALSSGDHLPDMKDFDLSYNLSECTTIAPPRPGQSYYHWRGNSCPTKTPLLNTDTRPSRHCGPHSPREFWSFRNFSLSPEFIEMCDACRNGSKEQELKMVQDLKLGYESRRALPSNNVQVPGEDIKKNDAKNEVYSETQAMTVEKQDELASVSQIHSNENTDRGDTDGSRTSSLTSVDTKVPAKMRKNVN